MNDELLIKQNYVQHLLIQLISFSLFNESAIMQQL